MFMFKQALFLLILLLNFKSYGLDCPQSNNSCYEKKTTLGMVLCEKMKLLSDMPLDWIDRVFSTPTITMCIFKNLSLKSNTRKNISCSSTFKEVRIPSCGRAELEYVCLPEGSENERISNIHVSATCKEGNWLIQNNY